MENEDKKLLKKQAKMQKKEAKIALKREVKRDKAINLTKNRKTGEISFKNTQKVKKNRKSAQVKHQKDTNKQKKEYRAYCQKNFLEFNENGKPTIAIFCDTFFPIVDGVIVVMDNYAKRLAKMCNVVMFVPEHKGKTIKKDEYLVVGIKSVYFKFVGYDLAFPELDGDLNRLIKQLRIDLIHCHSPFLVGEYAAKLAKKRKIPFVTTFHSQYKKDFYKNTKSKALTKMILARVMKVFNASTETWTMHSASRQTLIDYGYKGKNILLMPNATDMVPTEAVLNSRSEIEEKLGIGQNQTMFIFIGRLIEVKNIFFIADVLKLLTDRGVDFKMVFVGDGPDSERLKHKINALGLKERVVFTGKVTDREYIAKLLNRADLFLFPSLYDVSSIVQIEAACFKTPVVFAEGSVTSCTITPEVNGFISPCDEALFADKIQEILADEAKLKAVGEKARSGLYVTWDDVIEAAYQRYLYLIEQNNQPNLEITQKVDVNKN